MRMRNSVVRRTDAAEDINRDEAQRFLNLIRARNCAFQTFDDDAERKNPNLAKIFHGALDEYAEELTRLNKLRAGVFVALNQMDGDGRKKTNVKRIRAVALDLDGESLDPVKDCKLKPHIIVESSPGRYHVYWLVKHLATDDFEDLQRGLAKRFNGDPAVALLTHCARLPGFLHNKATPFLTRIVEVNETKKYTAEQLKAEFPPEAEPHRPPKSMKDKLVLPHDAPVQCAREFVKMLFLHDGVQTLRYYRGAFYEWRGTHYELCDADHLRSQLYQFLDAAVTFRRNGYVAFNPTPHKVSAVLDALKSLVEENGKREQPFFMGPLDKAQTANLLAFKNGVFDIETRELSPHTALLFNVNCLPFDYDADASEAKEWRRFLLDLWPEDKEARITLAEIFGLMLTDDTSFQKIFMLVGPKRSGKGTIGRVLTALIGKDAVRAPTLNSLGSNFGVSPLIDTRVAIISDARMGAQNPAERLLSISGEDTQQVDRKYRDPWTGRLGVRFVILTNELPKIADSSGALASRYVVLTLTNSFLGKEDLDLTPRLLKELPGILNWALRGLDRLRKRGRFKMPESSLEAIRQLEDLASPVGAFVRDWCGVGPDKRVRVATLYDAYCKWCETEGHKSASNIVFGRNLRAVLPRVHAPGHGSQRRYEGVELSAEGDETPLRHPVKRLLSNSLYPTQRHARTAQLVR